MSQSTTADTDVLDDLDQAGAPVKSRVGGALQAWTISQRFVDLDAIRAQRRTKVQGMIDGNAPKTPATMQKEGRAGEANLNWREAKGHILNSWTPYYDLVCEVPVCVDLDLDYAGSSTDAELARGFSEYFHEMVFGWDGYDLLTQLRDLQMLVHGIGTVVWEDPWDWRPKPILTGDFYVNDRTKVDLENCGVAMVSASVEAGSLWRQIQDEMKASALGWKPKAIREAIMRNGLGDAAWGNNWKWERWQQMFKNGEAYVSQKLARMIPIRSLFVDEMDEGVSQHVLSGNGALAPRDFLFSKVNRYDSWDQCVCVFPFDVGSDGTLHSVKGLGTEIFAYCELANRIKNNLADLILTGAKPMFQMANGGDIPKIQMVKMGGYNIVPQGLNLLQQNIGNGVSSLLEVSQAFEGTLMQNTGTYRQNSSNQAAVERTAKEVTINALDQAKLSKGAHNRHMRCMDRLYREMWRRAASPNLNASMPGAKAALIFQAKCAKLCERLNVKPEALYHVENVRAVRSLGLGSAAMRIEIANAMMQQYPLLDPVGQSNLLRMYFSALTSYHSVDALVPRIDTGRDVTNDESIAALENNALNTGEGVLVDPRQNHELHLDVHLPSMEADVQALEQGADMRDIFGRLERKGQHAHIHLGLLAKNPTKQTQAKAFAERLRVLAGVQDTLQQNIEEQDQAAAQQPQPGQSDPEMVKVQGNLELKAKKQDAEMALKIQKQQQDARLKGEAHHADLVLKAATTAANTRLADIETAARLRRDAAESAAAVQSSTEKAA